MADNSQSRTARRKQKEQAKKTNKTKKKTIFKRIFMAILIIGIVCAVAIGVLFAYYISKAPTLDEAKLSDPLPLEIYDINDELFAELGAEKRTKITYDEIPQVLEDAVIATEDARFRKHMGIDFQRIMAAVYANVTEGFGSQGASTITQQVVKNAFLSPEKSLERKVQEQWLALRLEQKFSKDEILTMYLNKIYYGNGAYGAAKAAEVYFNKELKELTLPEAALLAGLPQRPSAYDPFENPDLAEERRNTVLDLMVQHEKITQQKAEEAKQVSVPSMMEEGDQNSDIPYDFLDLVTKEVEQKLDGANLYEDGLRVYTTLDPNAQQKTEELLSEDSPITFPNDQFQAGITVMDTQTGAIRAIGGGRNKEKISGSYNYAIQATEPPGSTFKPIIDYGPAIEYNNWSTYHQINDEAYSYEDAPEITISNAGRGYRGWVSMREALVDSLNVPAVKTMNEIGREQSKSFAEGLGIKFDDDKVVESDAIGGGTEVSTLDLAGAFAAFGNEGVYNEPYTVRRVEFQGGRTPVEFEPQSHVAMKDSTAYMVTDMLKDVVQSGTGTKANVPGVPVAGKTGTTNREDGTTPDSWFAGYSTNYTISIWTGYPKHEGDLSSTDDDIAMYLFRDIMTHISQGIDTRDFEKPDSVVEVAIEKGTNPAKLPSPYTPSDMITTELFVKGAEPSNTSNSYEKLDPVKNVNGRFDPETESLQLSWDYNQDENNPVVFTVTGGVKGESKQTVLSESSDTSVQISDAKRDSTYVYDIVAIRKGDSSLKSDPISVQVKIPAEEEKKEEETDEEGNNEENQELNEEETDGEEPEQETDEGTEENNQNDDSTENGNTETEEGNNNNDNGNSQNQGDNKEDTDEDETEENNDNNNENTETEDNVETEENTEQSSEQEAA
ncbi:penicillin-binding protein 1A [Pontibacillus litoralis]|uniref:Penicillin-binding protein 1A n=1 Tax=Pontibacillus litoralis JSM 072002 TaxID=1385512 RepID=A0A0A5G9T0_9BACI|nr:penicillin-binding protein 1A [Pontibacillus litoralis]KGX87933.1 penicillin-binding protein 1A [Pontibacillus litoralis JSM 072002]